jgi:hypothetical protein
VSNSEEQREQVLLSRGETAMDSARASVFGDRGSFDRLAELPIDDRRALASLPIETVRWLLRFFGPSWKSVAAARDRMTSDPDAQEEFRHRRTLVETIDARYGGLTEGERTALAQHPAIIALCDRSFTDRVRMLAVEASGPDPSDILAFAQGEMLRLSRLESETREALARVADPVERLREENEAAWAAAEAAEKSQRRAEAAAHRDRDERQAQFLRAMNEQEVGARRDQ